MKWGARGDSGPGGGHSHNHLQGSLSEGNAGVPSSVSVIWSPCPVISPSLSVVSGFISQLVIFWSSSWTLWGHLSWEAMGSSASEFAAHAGPTLLGALSKAASRRLTEEMRVERLPYAWLDLGQSHGGEGSQGGCLSERREHCRMWVPLACCEKALETCEVSSAPPGHLGLPVRAFSLC